MVSEGAVPHVDDLQPGNFDLATRSAIFLVTFAQKCPFLDPKKWHFEWPNQNSKTTFIVQTFPKYGPYGFDLVNLSLLGPILAKFQFC